MIVKFTFIQTKEWVGNERTLHAKPNTTNESKRPINRLNPICKVGSGENVNTGGNVDNRSMFEKYYQNKISQGSQVKCGSKSRINCSNPSNPYGDNSYNQKQYELPQSENITNRADEDINALLRDYNESVERERNQQSVREKSVKQVQQYDEQPIQRQYEQPIQQQYEQPMQRQYEQPIHPQYEQPLRTQQPYDPQKIAKLQFEQQMKPKAQYEQPMRPQPPFAQDIQYNIPKYETQPKSANSEIVTPEPQPEKQEQSPSYEEIYQYLKEHPEAAAKLSSNTEEENIYSSVTPKEDIQNPAPKEDIDENIYAELLKEENNSKLPKGKESPLILPKVQRNYIQENKKLISDKKIPQKPRQKKTPEPAIHKDYGKTPEYIDKYKKEAELKKEMIRKKKEEAKYPKGTKLLTEEERLETLNGLISTRDEIQNILNRMPITNRTLSIQKKKEELIEKLDEIEKAIQTFSRKQVFIKAQKLIS